MFPQTNGVSPRNSVCPPSPFTSSPFGTESLVACTYETLRLPLLRYFTQMSGDEDEAEDLCHDLFLSLLIHLARTVQIQSLDHYIWHSAHNRAIDLYRKRNRRPPPADIDDPALPLPDPDPDPCTVAIAAERTAALHAAIDQLPPTHADVARYALTTDATLPETAAALGITLYAAKTRHYRALTALRTHTELHP